MYLTKRYNRNMLCNILQTYINDEFIHDFEHDIPLSEGNWFKVKVHHSNTVAVVQTSYIEMCKE